MDDNAQKINIDQVLSNCQGVYRDEYVVIFNYIPQLAEQKLYKLEMLTCYAISKGRLQFDLNGKTYMAEQGDAVVCLPNSYLEKYLMSPDLEASVVGISYDVLQRSMNLNKNYWNILKYIAVNPVIRLSDDERELLLRYGGIFRHKLSTDKKPYHKEIIHSLLRCLFLELCSIISPRLNAGVEGGVLRHGEQLFTRFLALLSANEGKERSVRAYAEQLCITPKYLSTLSKSASGRPALSWIHQFAVEAIERRLKYTDKSIKQISDEMNFPNLSFFGKFTKAHLGKSPTEYRKQLSEV